MVLSGMAMLYQMLVLIVICGMMKPKVVRAVLHHSYDFDLIRRAFELHQAILTRTAESS